MFLLVIMVSPLDRMFQVILFYFFNFK